MSKTLGFYDFHISADKTRDYFLKNGFRSVDLLITKIIPGQDPFIAYNGKADTATITTEKPDGQDKADLKDEHHPIREFFYHLLHLSPREKVADKPFIAEDGGFILSVNTTTPDDTQLAKEILESRGAQYIKVF